MVRSPGDGAPGAGVIDAGDVLEVSNETGEETVIYALFFELPAEGPLTIFEEDPGC